VSGWWANLGGGEMGGQHVFKTSSNGDRGIIVMTDNKVMNSRAEILISFVSSNYSGYCLKGT